MLAGKLNRSRFLKTTVATTAVIAMPYVRGAYAAGKLSIGFWDHWVPGANKASQQLCEEWGAKNKVEVQIDYITSQGNKNLLTIAAEAQARSGHDIFAFPTWQPADHANQLEPVDDVMAELIKLNGKVNPTVEYLAKTSGHWVGGAGLRRQPDQGPVLAHRSDEEARRHRRAGDVSGGRAAQGRHLDARRHAQGGRGLPQGRPSVRHRARRRPRTTSTPPARSSSRSAPHLVDAKGNITVKTDAVRQALEYYKKLAQWLPPDAPAWDNASNNKYLIVRQGRADHEPAERLGGRQARRAEGRRAAVDARHAVRARRAATRRSCRTSGASGTSARTSRRPRACCCICRSRPRSRRWWWRAGGYDLPSFEKLTTLKIWAEEGPPKGTLYHYPNPHNHQILSVAAPPAPPKIAVQIYTQAIQTKMIVRFMQGEPMEKTLAWAESEVEGYMRT